MSSGSGTSAGTPPTTSTPSPIQRPSSSRNMMWAAVAVVVVVIVVLVVAWQAGVFGKASTNNGSCTPPAAKITGEGSTLVFPLMYFWGTTWATKAAGSSVNYASLGSGAGITAITGHTANFGASDAPLNPGQRAAAPGLMLLPESAGGVVPIYNVPGLSKPLNFTGQVLAEIYNENITMWNDPAIKNINQGVNLPSSSIIPVHRSDGSGTTFIFSSYLALSSNFWAAKYGHATIVSWPNAPNTEVASPGNSGVAASVKTTTDSIGYVDINYALSNSISYGAVKNPQGNYILANLTNTASALADANPALPTPMADWYNVSVLNANGPGDYPIVSFTYLLVFQDMGKAFGSLITQTQVENLVSFLHWIVTVGQQYAAQLFYIPLPASTVAYDQAEINSMVYNGQSFSVCVPS